MAKYADSPGIWADWFKGVEGFGWIRFLLILLVMSIVLPLIAMTGIIPATVAKWIMIPFLLWAILGVWMAPDKRLYGRIITIIISIPVLIYNMYFILTVDNENGLLPFVVWMWYGGCFWMFAMGSFVGPFRPIIALVNRFRY
jgi:hypothetical protein